MGASRYQDLIVWQRAIGFVKKIYLLSAKLPGDEVFGLKSQLRRAAISIPSNIAEGQGRNSAGEFRQFLGHARGSLYEVETQIQIGFELGYVSQQERDALLRESAEIGRLLNGLMSSIRKTVLSC